MHFKGLIFFFWIFVTLSRKIGGGVRPECKKCYTFFFFNEGFPKSDTKILFFVSVSKLKSGCLETVSAGSGDAGDTGPLSWALTIRDEAGFVYNGNHCYIVQFAHKKVTANTVFRDSNNNFLGFNIFFFHYCVTVSILG